MAFTKEKKQEIVSQYGKDVKNTGAPEAQIALLTEKINYLTQHLQDNPKDTGTRRGLMKMVGKRRRMQAYFKGNSTHEEYQELLQALGLRK